MESAWKLLLREAVATDGERIVKRLEPPATPAEGAHSSDLQRSLFASFGCPADLQSHGSVSSVTTADLIRHVRLLHFDFGTMPCRDNARAVADCQVLLADGDSDEAAELCDELVDIAARKRADGGSLDLAGLLATLPARFRLRTIRITGATGIS